MTSRDREKNTEDKKNKYCSDVLDCIDKYLSIFVKVLPFLGLFAVLPLYYYAHEENINIFSHYSSWVSFLPVIASAELLVGAGLFSIVFVPGIQFRLLSHLCSDKESTLLKRQILIFFQHFLMLVFIIVGMNYPDAYNQVLFSCILLLLIGGFCLASFFICGHKNNSAPFFISLFIVGLAVVYISFFSAVAIAYLLAIDNTGWGSSVLGILIFLSIVLVIVDISKKDHENIELFKFSVFLLAFLSLFITPFSTAISRAALIQLEVGSGVKRTYYFIDNTHNKLEIPDEFRIDECCIDNFCFTKKLSIIWGVGDLIYVGVPSKQNPPIKQHIAIPRNILIPYNLNAPLPDVCKTEEESKKVTDKGQKKQK